MTEAGEPIPSAEAVPTEAPVADPYHRGGQTDEARPPKKLWKRALGWSKWLVSAALIAWVLTRTDLGAIGKALKAVDPRYIAGAFGLIPLGLVIGAFRWRWLLAANGVRASIPFLIGSGCVASFVRLFLPSTIGGDAVRVYDSWRAGASKSLAVATIGVDRLLGLFALALLASGAMAFNPRVSSIPMARWVALAAAGGMLVVIGWIFFVGPRAPAWVLSVWRIGPAPLRRPFEKLFAALGTFHGKHGALASVFALGVLLQLNVVAFYWLIARGLGLEISFVQMLAAAPIAVFVMLIPITINGIGLREGIWIVLLGAYGFSEADAVALSWIELGLFVLFGLIGGVVYAARK
ncbi:MAG: membrane protein [Phycisphaeraceae bacterium]|nr:MAG: membrane protein [Phycisphaeraceae bacterium]